MSIEELRIFYKDFLEKMVDNGLDFFEDKDENRFIDWCEDNSRDLDFFFANGMTKIVLWEDELPYVIKIPFLNEYHRTDYCKKEVENYKAARRDFPEILDCFAWCDFLFDFCGFPIYIMEKIDCDEVTLSDRAYSAAYEKFVSYDEGCEEEEVAEKFSNEYYNWSGDEQTESLIYEEWSFEKVQAFLEFCAIREINDRHVGNWGYRGDQLVIVDYSGF